MKFIDPSTKRKNNIVKERLQFFNNIPLFSILEFNIIAACTRKCSFCPVSDKDFYKKIDVKGMLDLNFYEKILNDLKKIDYKGKILFSGFSEPLLHPKIEEIIILTRKYLPYSRIEIITNGDRLNSEKLQSIFRAGLDTISISMYDGAHQIEYFTSMKKDAKLNEEQVILRRRYYEDGNYGLTISNRAGLLNSNDFRDEKEDKVLKLPLKKVCYYPFYMMKIDFNGDVLLCSHDWQKKFIIGNLNKNTILELWTSERLNKFKNRLANKDRSLLPCMDCDVHGDVIGAESFNSWNEYIKKVTS